jgi:hypothetical protein
VFESSLDYQAGTGEHPMEFFEVYKDYLDRFEKRIEDYICSVSFLKIFSYYLLTFVIAWIQFKTILFRLPGSA